MKLIVGLGNPGTKYTNTRHNIGFFMLTTFAQKYAAPWQEKAKFHGEVAEVTIAREKVLLFKPNTFYNDSGPAVRAIKDFYKIENKDILVIHDELSLPLGTIRTRLGGSDAGNNGVKSITAHIGDDYARVKIGIYNELRDQQNDADFVLSTLTKNESETLTASIQIIQKILAEFASDIFEPTSYTT